jgi:CHC2 zinc finger
MTSDRVLRSPAMPGIRFAEVRARVTMAEVLGLVGFVPRESSGDQVRGPCPVHHSSSPSGRSFSANLRLHIYRCFKCGSSGNHLDLYAATTGRGLFEATIELCERLNREIPGYSKTQRARPGQPVATLPPRGAGASQRCRPARAPAAAEGRGQTDHAATAEVVPTGPKKWCLR